MISYTIHVTATNGAEASVTGSQTAIEQIEKALFAGGARFDKNTECWDFGYYKDSANYERRAPESVS